MKQLKMTALAIALTTAAAGSAMAQSTKTNAWEGAYGQWSAGFASFSPKIGATTIAPSGSLAYYPSLLGQTVNVGTSADTLNTATNAIAAGYNFGINESYVLGLGASYYIGATGSGNGSFTLSAPGGATGLPSPYPPALPALNKTSPIYYQLKNLWSVTLNPGYVIDKNRLVYGKIGYTGVTIGINSSTAPYQTTGLSGLALGIGYKQMITESIYLMGEANYGSFGNKATSLSSSNGTFSSTVSGTGYDLLIGVGYRF
jgi:outer membrane immunogenic protein